MAFSLDPADWIGPEDVSREEGCGKCGEMLSDGECCNPFCEGWRFGAEFDALDE